MKLWRNARIITKHVLITQIPVLVIHFTKCLQARKTRTTISSKREFSISTPMMHVLPNLMNKHGLKLEWKLLGVAAHRLLLYCFCWEFIGLILNYGIKIERDISEIGYKCFLVISPPQVNELLYCCWWLTLLMTREIFYQQHSWSFKFPRWKKLLITFGHMALNMFCVFQLIKNSVCILFPYDNGYKWCGLMSYL